MIENSWRTSDDNTVDKMYNIIKSKEMVKMKSRWFYLGLGFGMGYFYSRYLLKRREAPRAKQPLETEPTLERPKPGILLEIGRELIPLVAEEQEGGLLHYIPDIRSRCADELGVALPAVRIMDSDALENNDYSISIKDVRVGNGSILVERYLAVSNDNVEEPIAETEAFVSSGLPGLWITEADKEKAIAAGYTILTPWEALANHLLELFKQHAHKWLGLQETQDLLTNLSRTKPAVVSESVPNTLSLVDVKNVLKKLLEAQISIRDLSKILETLADNGRETKDIDALAALVREAIGE